MEGQMKNSKFSSSADFSIWAATTTRYFFMLWRAGYSTFSILQYEAEAKEWTAVGHIKGNTQF